MLSLKTPASGRMGRAVAGALAPRRRHHGRVRARNGEYAYDASAHDAAAPEWRSRRLLRFGRETAGLHAWRHAPSFGVRTALGPFLLKGVPH